MVAAQLNDPKSTLSDTLRATAHAIEESHISLRQMLTLVGEQGMLLFCVLLTVPFLLPVSIPGVSTPFGLLILFIGIGITLNRVPWLPAFLMERRFAAEHLKPTLHKGADLLARIDRFIRPRLLILTGSVTINRCNGLLIMLAALLLMLPLMLPLGAIPFTNAMPAWAILLLAIGMLQRDGLFVALGYALVAATLVWFSALAIGLLMAGQNISTLFG
ncbi:exopolysaccharide biosynthesis protein [Aeromonas caviae]|uniref:exopolysaccharide biosynthesis protein n=1 Tax=Aeromonas caviae TaxID=648 RepID=UPI0029D66CCD|nr:exopolysaccharide biosynthesis protein [Aeromonas caviae]MDX7682866.1 exopolysaccharide biosynthesis protein [Aeromonas caviae]MDX7729208.1 exopolysaccharide biosynthesis protein [Aeromonas caviae]